jgi:hypothetical protein
MTSGSDVAKNIESCKRLINKAKNRGAKVCKVLWYFGVCRHLMGRNADRILSKLPSLPRANRSLQRFVIPLF